MKQKLLPIFLFLLISCGSFAQASLVSMPVSESIRSTAAQTVDNSIQLRYCTDNLTRSLGVAASAEVEVAIFIPKKVTNKYAGESLTKIKVGFGQNAASNTKIFIRTSLNADPVYTQAVNFTTSSWNEITLETPYEIKPNEDLYIGYSFKSGTGNSIYSLGLDDSSKADPNGDLIKYTIGSKTYDWDHIGSQGFTNFCIIGIVEGENLPQYDVDFYSLEAPLSAVDVDESFSVTGSIKNIATQTITSLDVSYKIGDNDKIMMQTFTGLNIPNNGKYDFLITGINFDKTAGTEYPIAVSVEKINGNDDESLADNTQNAVITVWNAPKTPSIVNTQPANKNVIIEEYTGIYCQYCPDGHKRVNQIIKDNPGRVSAINVHQGGYAIPGANDPDFRTEWGDELANQTGLEGYPAATINRHVFAGGVTATSNRANFTTYSSTILKQASYVNVGVNTTIDEATRQLIVDVELYYTANTSATNRLNVALLQDSILGPQTGGSSYYPEMVKNGKYQHNHMLRDLLTKQWGDLIDQTTSGTFVAKRYSYSIPEAIRDIPVNLEKIEIVAYVAEGTQEIISGSSTKLDQSAGTGISSVKHAIANAYIYDNSLFIQSDAPVQSVAVYNISGQKVLSAPHADKSVSVERLNRGIYIVKLTTADGEKVVKVRK
jgi:hypothetical protein